MRLTNYIMKIKKLTLLWILKNSASLVDEKIKYFAILNS